MRRGSPVYIRARVLFISRALTSRRRLSLMHVREGNVEAALWTTSVSYGLSSGRRRSFSGDFGWVSLRYLGCTRVVTFGLINVNGGCVYYL